MSRASTLRFDRLALVSQRARFQRGSRFRALALFSTRHFSPEAYEQTGECRDHERVFNAPHGAPQGVRTHRCHMAKRVAVLRSQIPGSPLRNATRKYTAVSACGFVLMTIGRSATTTPSLR